MPGPHGLHLSFIYHRQTVRSSSPYFSAFDFSRSSSSAAAADNANGQTSYAEEPNRNNITIIIKITDGSLAPRVGNIETATGVVVNG